jgi:hypothetical protein
MPSCPKCDRPMATVLKREGGQTRTYYECPVCTPPPRGPKREKDAS